MVFFNCHSHTSASYLDAIIKPSDLFARAKELGQSAVAITDHGTLANAWTCYKEYAKYKKTETPIKLVLGNEIYFCEDLTEPKAKRRHLVLLAANHTGYKNLLRITAAGFEKPATVMGKIFPRVDAEILRKYNEGLFATSACGGSIIAAHIFKGERAQALKAAEIFKDIFGDRFFIELQPHTLRRDEFSQEFLNDQLKSIAEELGIEMVATCDSHYLTAAHEKYHDMILAISSKKALDDPDRHRYSTFEPCIVCRGTGLSSEESAEPCYECLGAKGKTKPCAEFYIKSEEQIRSFFTKRYGAAFAERLIQNTSKIADACEPPDYMEPKGVRLPKFDIRHIKQASDCEEFETWLAGKTKMKELPIDWAYMRFKAWKGFGEYTKNFDKETKDKYWKRVLFEVEILESRDFCSYMLIVSDFMVWARNNGIEVGPGRGSASSSLLGFLLKIHDIDSIQYGLVFERFQNRERKQVPDIDLDISPRNRERVVDYVANKYGHDCVAQISNINTITPKIAIKDITRSLNIGGDKSAAFKIANDITAIIPDKAHIKDENGLEKIIKIDTMELAIKHSGKELAEFLQQYPEVLDYANQLVGLPRAAGVHAAGVIISDVPLNEYAPMRRDKDGRLVCQLDKDQCEEMGLIKFDFLGLDTLDVLRDAYDLAKGIGLELPEPAKIPPGDKNAYNLIKSGKVVGVFQLEGDTLAPLCKPFAPQSVPDIAALSALGRPGCSVQERKEFIDRRFGKAEVSFQHRLLKGILDHTYGVKVFDEDLILLGQKLTGWPLSKADVLRKITKLKEKGRALVEKTKGEFIEATIKHSKIPNSEATRIWDEVVEPFSKYGFCRSLAPSTKIFVVDKGPVEISKVLPGDRVISIDAEGLQAETAVVKNHDHGMVPMWEIEFEDGTKEKCTLDHKWLTKKGQQPLWKIIEEEMETLGVDQKEKERQVGLLRMHEKIPDCQTGKSAQARMRAVSKNAEDGRPIGSKGAYHEVWNNEDNEGQRPWGSPEKVQKMPADVKKNKAEVGPTCMQTASISGSRLGVFSKTGSACAQDSQSRSVACRERQTQENAVQGSGAENSDGRFDGKTSDPARLPKEWPGEMRSGVQEAQERRFYQREDKDSGRVRRSLPFLSDLWRGELARYKISGQNVGGGNNAPQRVEIDPIRLLQLQLLRRAYAANYKEDPKIHTQTAMQNLKGRAIVRATYLGIMQAYDLEVEHPEHNFLLASGLCTSNSHATAYGELGYRTAYYKYYAPAAFLAAKLNAETSKSTGTEEDIEIIKKDAKSFGIQITPCDINVSKKYYALKDRRTIVTGFSAIKGLGEKALEALIQHQPYKSFEDFLDRTPSTTVNKSVVVALAKAGAFDSLGIGRKYAAEHYAQIRTEMLAFKKGDKKPKKIKVKKSKRERELEKMFAEFEKQGVEIPADLYGEWENLQEAGAIAAHEAETEMLLEAARNPEPPPDMSKFVYSAADKASDEWTMKEKLIGEKEVLGEYVSGSVDLLYPGFFKGGVYGIPFSKIALMSEKQSYYLEGIIGSVSELKIKKVGKNQGKPFGKLVVENLKGETIELTVWSEPWAKHKKALTIGSPIRALTKVNEFNGVKNLVLANLEEVWKERK